MSVCKEVSCLWKFCIYSGLTSHIIYLCVYLLLLGATERKLVYLFHICKTVNFFLYHILATGRSHVSFSIPSRERRTDFPITSTSVSTTVTKGGGRTLRSLPASTRLAQTTEIYTTSTATTRSPDNTHSSLGAQGGSSRDATVSSMDSLLMGSPAASESTSPGEL